MKRKPQPKPQPKPKQSTKPVDRLKKREVRDLLIDIFVGQPDEGFSMKDLFSLIHAKHHGIKALIMDVVHEMMDAEFVYQMTRGVYALNPAAIDDSPYQKKEKPQINYADYADVMHAILAEYGLPAEYPKEVTEAAEKIEPGITPEEIARREDFRDVLTFTIDPKDAKDFDDALSIRRIDTKPTADNPQPLPMWEVGVHIADVSHYVKEGDIIDREAQHRATSIYLVDRTIPMLPERLCNYICSLRPGEDKLCYSAIFTLDAEANVKRWRLAHTVIRSDRRFTYEEVQPIIKYENEGENENEDENEGEGRGPAEVSAQAFPATDGGGTGTTTASPEAGEPLSPQLTEALRVLWALAEQIRARRFKAGAIGFERPEVRFDIAPDGTPLGTYIVESNESHWLIEEFMLLANRSVAESVGKKTLPYRIHDLPDPEKMENLRQFTARWGYKLKTEGSKKEVSRSLNKLLADVKGKREEALVEMVALRCMAKARYSVKNIGHYGLMFPYYTHFTSPIRRYPDTMVHRLMTHYQAGGRSASAQKYENLCEHSSAMEQLAAQAERASIKYKQVEYMGARLGQDFEATVSGVTEFGLYVECDDNHCEGLIPVRDLEGDYYDFDERNYCLVGRRRKKRFCLGDRLLVRVARANLEKRQLDFELLERL